MTLILAGGTGHLGALLARRLASQGHQLVVLTRGRASASSTPNGPLPRLI